MPRIPSKIPRIACGGRSFLTLVLPIEKTVSITCFEGTLQTTGRLSLLTPSNPHPCLKFLFCAFKVTLGLVRSYVTFAILDIFLSIDYASKISSILECLFGAAGTCLASRCLATIRIHTDTQPCDVISLLLFSQIKENRPMGTSIVYIER
jgi:hypothetical protein